MEVREVATVDHQYDSVSTTTVELMTMSEKGSAKSSKAGQDLWWSNVNFTAGTAKILTNCWGHVPSGKVCAILGPSGAGKSSLLNVLAGRSASTKTVKVEGTVKIGSRKINPVQYRKHIAYVMQDDALMATATPREALMFSAVMRLPSTTTNAELTEMVDKLIVDLGLTECADVIIGGPLIKGISGGQRKRTSVGVELITDPAILFLDEPTSGLDSHSASNLVKLLKSMAESNSAVLCTIHQPSSEVFALFDIVIFMQAGRIFYQGPGAGINTFYADLGHKCPENYNPADFVMNLCQSTTGEALECMYAPVGKDFESTEVESYSAESGESEKRVRSSFSKQLIQLAYREVLHTIRDPFALMMRYVVVIILGVFYGLIFLNIGSQDNGDTGHFNSHVGLVVNCMISTLFASAQPIMLSFPFERPMFLREYSTGTYTTTAYLIAKLFTEMPLTLLQMMVQYMFAKTMSDLQGNYFQFVAIAFGLAMCSNSLAMILGAGSSDVKEVTEASVLLFVPQILYAGFFTRLNQIPEFLRWAQYLCGLSYATKLAFLVEFSAGQKSCNTSPEASQNCASLLASGDDKDLFWVAIICLFMLSLVGRIVAGVILTMHARKFY